MLLEGKDIKALATSYLTSQSKIDMAAENVFEELVDVLIRPIAGKRTMSLLHDLFHDLRKVAPDSLCFCFSLGYRPASIVTEKLSLRIE